LDYCRDCDADERLVLFWFFRRGQLAFRPPGMRLALNGIVMEVLA
jgi:hypothetical protein